MNPELRQPFGWEFIDGNEKENSSIEINRGKKRTRERERGDFSSSRQEGEGRMTERVRKTDSAWFGG